jgi:hypothetical protein
VEEYEYERGSLVLFSLKPRFRDKPDMANAVSGFNISRRAYIVADGRFSQGYGLMKLRHVAALALVGWYLMLAPPYQDSSGHVGLGYGAPLSKWINLRAFETADQCEVYKPIARKSLKSQIDAQSNKTADYWPEVFGSFATTQCVATDDPRLKPN